MRKGSLELAVLLLLRRKRAYGLQLVDALSREFDLGVSEGSIYPLLSRLRQEAKVEAEWVDEGTGHPRRYYRLTEHGRAVCKAMLVAWRDYVRAFARLTGDRDE
jgi:PadR family transcriptional regulator PadR